MTCQHCMLSCDLGHSSWYDSEVKSMPRHWFVHVSDTCEHVAEEPAAAESACVSLGLQSGASLEVAE